MIADLDQFIDEIRTELAALGTAERAVNEKRYLKSDLDFLGVKVPVVRKRAKVWLRARGAIERDELLELTGGLWTAGVHELRSFAVDLSIFRLELLGLADLEWIERWLREAKTWAHVDAISVNLVGGLLARQPRVAKTLDRWARDDDFWVRRAAMLALLPGLRAGEGDWDRFVGYADSMLEEKEFFIRKAIGWILREASKKTPELVVDYVSSRRERMSGLTYREATRRLDDGARAMLSKPTG